MLKRIFSSNIIVSLTSNGLGAALGLLTFAVLTRSISQSDLGEWMIFLGIYGLVELLRTGTLQMALIRLRARADYDQDHVLGSTWMLSALITSATAMLCLIIYLVLISLGIYPENARMTLWIGVISLCGMPFNFMLWLYQADGKFRKILSIRLTFLLAFLAVLVVLPFIAHLDLIYCYAGYALAYALASVHALWQRNSGITHFFKAKKAVMIEMLQFGKFSMGTMIASNLLRNSDNILILIMLGKPAVAAYAVPFRFIELLEMPLRSVVSTYMPRMAAAIAGNSENPRKLYVSYTGVLTIVFVPIVIGVVLLAKWVVVLLSGWEYVNSTILLQILIIYCIFVPLDRFSGVTLDLLGKPKINFQKVLIMLAVNVVGDLIALHYFADLRMVALASWLTFFSGLIFGNLFLSRFYEFSYLDCFREGWRLSSGFVQTKLKR